MSERGSECACVSVCVSACVRMCFSVCVVCVCTRWHGRAHECVCLSQGGGI